MYATSKMDKDLLCRIYKEFLEINKKERKYNDKRSKEQTNDRRRSLIDYKHIQRCQHLLLIRGMWNKAINLNQFMIS